MAYGSWLLVDLVVFFLQEFMRVYYIVRGDVDFSIYRVTDVGIWWFVRWNPEWTPVRYDVVRREMLVRNGVCCLDITEVMEVIGGEAVFGLLRRLCEDGL
jgi:hypothetical protein